MRRLCLVLAVCLAATSDAAHAATSCDVAGCVNAVWGPGQIAAGFGEAPFRPGQTFTPKLTGELGAVHLGLESTTGTGVAAIAEIRATVNGLPTSAVIAEAVVPGAPYTGGVLHSVDFSAQHLVLVQGTRYAVTLRSTSHQYILAAFPPCFTTTGANDYVYSDDAGQTWAKLPTRDRSFIFEVCMDVPTAARRDTWGRVKTIYR